MKFCGASIQSKKPTQILWVGSVRTSDRVTMIAAAVPCVYGDVEETKTHRVHLSRYGLLHT